MIDRARILLVEDDDDLCDLCARILEKAGYAVAAVGNGEEALGQLERRRYQLAIFDWHLPGLAGRSLLETVGWRWPELPIVVMTGYSDEDKAVTAVEFAQAYLRKPFERQALLDTVSRVIHRVSTRRGGDLAAENREPRLQVGSAEAEPPRVAHGVEINPHRCEARAGDGVAVSLTATEYAVLNHLYMHRGEVVPHQALARLLNDRPLSAKEAAALCKHHIRALRAKLEPDPARPVFILTVWGRGYRLASEGS